MLLSGHPQNWELARVPVKGQLGGREECSTSVTLILLRLSTLLSRTNSSLQVCASGFCYMSYTAHIPSGCHIVNVGGKTIAH